MNEWKNFFSKLPEQMKCFITKHTNKDFDFIYKGDGIEFIAFYAPEVETEVSISITLKEVDLQVWKRKGDWEYEVQNLKYPTSKILPFLPHL